jgi:hypothetical protein
MWNLANDVFVVSIPLQLADIDMLFASDMFNFFSTLLVYASGLKKIDPSLAHLICITTKLSRNEIEILLQ